MSSHVTVYTRFNRFWHWSQAALIIGLGITGFEIHGSFHLLGFAEAVRCHNALAAAFGVLLAFALFWHLTTGQWRHYRPTRRGLAAMVGFYLQGIFRGESHPFKRTELARLNPLQRLTYLALKVLIFPVQGLSGLACYFYNDLAGAGWLPAGLGTVAWIHTAGAFALGAFVIAHVYLTTTGETLTHNLRAMITGFEAAPASTPRGPASKSHPGPGLAAGRG